MTASRSPATPKPRPGAKIGGARSASRLGAIQALYQLELSDEGTQSVIREFIDHRLGKEVEGALYAEPDADLFKDLVEGVTRSQDDLDVLITGALTPDWPLKRLETVLRAILRAGAYELRFRVDVPTRVIINEYLDIAHAFFSGAEPGLVNGVLDRLAKECRGGA